MTLKQGWINRQFAHVERDAKNWPDWMRRETEVRAQEQKARLDAEIKETGEQQTPAVKKAGGV